MSLRRQQFHRQKYSPEEQLRKLSVDYSIDKFAVQGEEQQLLDGRKQSYGINGWWSQGGQNKINSLEGNRNLEAFKTYSSVKMSSQIHEKAGMVPMKRNKYKSLEGSRTMTRETNFKLPANQNRPKLNLITTRDYVSENTVRLMDLYHDEREILKQRTVFANGYTLPVMITYPVVDRKDKRMSRRRFNQFFKLLQKAK